jgi:hypothetical protein
MAQVNRKICCHPCSQGELGSFVRAAPQEYGIYECTAEGADIPVYKYSPLFLVFYLPDPMMVEPVNKLIARIGKGSVFAVGHERAFQASDKGELSLRPNDWFLPNNSGELLVTIQVERSH